MKPYKSHYTTVILSFLSRACIRMRNITIDTLMVLFVLRAVGKLAENVEVQEACTMLDDFYCYINDNNKIQIIVTLIRYKELWQSQMLHSVILSCEVIRKSCH